jgi:DNA-binding GntR family transcriptional regulator
MGALRREEYPVAEWSADTPLHYQVREQMLNRILRGDWPAGLAIPAEIELSAQYNVSRPTVREAIRALRYEGYLQARRGSGTFVRRTLRDGPMILSADEVRREVRPVGEAEVALGAPVGSDVLMVERVSMRDGDPFALTYSFYARFTKTGFRRASSAEAGADTLTVSANVLNPYESDLLKDAPHTAIVLLEVLIHDADGAPVQLHRIGVPATLLQVRAGALENGARPLLDELGVEY